MMPMTIHVAIGWYIWFSPALLPDFTDLSGDMPVGSVKLLPNDTANIRVVMWHINNEYTYASMNVIARTVVPSLEIG